MTEDLEALLLEVNKLEHELEVYVPDVNRHLSQVCSELLESEDFNYPEAVKKYRNYLKDRLSEYKVVE